jgi:hypothetical protein
VYNKRIDTQEAIVMAGSLSRGYKVRVMTKKAWQNHPDKMVYWGNGKWEPALYNGDKMPIHVQFND